MLIQAKADQARITSVCIKRSACGFEAISRRRSAPAPPCELRPFRTPKLSSDRQFPQKCGSSFATVRQLNRAGPSETGGALTHSDAS